MRAGHPRPARRQAPRGAPLVGRCVARAPTDGESLPRESHEV
nr:MAG TPA: hypothetical protein [Caudoviricetes sp.]